MTALSLSFSFLVLSAGIPAISEYASIGDRYQVGQQRILESENGMTIVRPTENQRDEDVRGSRGESCGKEREGGR